MSARGPTHFRQRDLSRALKAAKIAGIEVREIAIEPTGRIVIATAEAPAGDRVPSEWDEATQ